MKTLVKKWRSEIIYTKWNSALGNLSFFILTLRGLEFKKVVEEKETVKQGIKTRGEEEMLRRVEVMQPLLEVQNEDPVPLVGVTGWAKEVREHYN